MSAFPFGDHPTFAQYLTWAAKKAGCIVRSGYGHDGDGAVYTMTTIKAPSGRSVIEVGTSQEERLVPTQIAYFDRRLDLKSPWFSPFDDEDLE